MGMVTVFSMLCGFICLCKMGNGGHDRRISHFRYDGTVVGCSAGSGERRRGREGKLEIEVLKCYEIMNERGESLKSPPSQL